MSKLLRSIGALVLIGVTVFSVYGFLAAPEAGPAAGSVRLLYSTIALASACAAGWLAWPRS
jgi:uncharacterized membrane protein YccC